MTTLEIWNQFRQHWVLDQLFSRSKEQTGPFSCIIFSATLQLTKTIMDVDIVTCHSRKQLVSLVYCPFVNSHYVCRKLSPQCRTKNTVVLIVVVFHLLGRSSRSWHRTAGSMSLLLVGCSTGLYGHSATNHDHAFAYWNSHVHSRPRTPTRIR